MQHTRERLVYNREEAAEALGLGQRTLDKMLADGTIRPTRIGRRVLIPREEIERLIREGTTA